MDDGPRFFTLDEANALVPTLQIEFGRVARARSEIGPVIVALGGADASMLVLRDEEAAPPGREAEAARLRALAAEITEAVERVNALGCLVKDVDAGLVDFYALQDGDPVFLCWQFGEPAISTWHGLEEGFAGRKPIQGAVVPAPAFPS
ncbi:MAG TPA: DUF2203 domain-containing protein [Anaeromyxobacter sp.]|nr:DUF2203 domain-containing protein [Anaeromyxobacter sp.]